MGSGGFQEAPWDLKAPIPAGTYHIQCDSIIIRSVDTTFDLIWRHGATDTLLGTWQQHWEPLPGGVYEAQPYEHDVTGAPAVDGEGQLIFRYTGMNATLDQAYIPNGDGQLSNGRIPAITIPQ